MDIYCPACGKKGRIDDAKIPDSGIFARCPGCKKKLWINKVDGVSLAEEPAPAIPSQDGKPPVTEAPPAAPPVAAPRAEAVSRSPVDTDGGQAGSALPSPASSPPPAPVSDSTPVDPVGISQQAPQAVPDPGFQVSPLPVPQAPAGMEPSTEGSSPGIQCNVCGNVFPDTDMVRFGDTMVCATCKPQYVQRMRTGVAKPGTFSYGGFWIRFVAKVIDGLILAIAQSIIITPLMIFFFKSAISAPDTTSFASFMKANVFINLISFAMGATYTTLFIGKYQATPGKMAFGLKVVAPDGGQISYMRALGRHFAEIVTALTLTIGYIMAGFDSQKRSLHDRICATRVIRK